jgi:hypothetical protein
VPQPDVTSVVPPSGTQTGWQVASANDTTEFETALTLF